jgi:hypothetical protein
MEEPSVDDSDLGMWDYPEHTQAKRDILGKYLDAWFPSCPVHMDASSS